MKKIILNLLIALCLIICTYFITIYNLKIEQVEKTEQGELITINGQKYFYEF